MNFPHAHTMYDTPQIKTWTIPANSTSSLVAHPRQFLLILLSRDLYLDLYHLNFA